VLISYDLTAQNCIFNANTASYGGALFFDAVQTQQPSSETCAGLFAGTTKFSNNHAAYAGAVMVCVC